MTAFDEASLDPQADPRRAKGVNYMGLVKLLKVYRRSQPLPEMSQAAQALMSERILISSWYPLSVLQELLQLTYEHVLGCDPDKALQMGVSGGRQTWGSAHRVYVQREDVMQDMFSMRHTWRNYFDFAELQVHRDGPGAMSFRVTGYLDMSEVHGLTIVGWHLAVPHLGGREDATVEVLEAPWQGAAALVHRVSVP